MKRSILAAVLFVYGGFPAHATEPNDTFATRTILSSGVFSVADELAQPSFPDTLLGIRGLFGDIYHVDDDSSHLGDGFASGVCIECDNESVVPTNEGSIDFSISGFGDDTFDGFHSESGQYEVFVNVYDFFDDLVDQFSEVHLLGPGVVHDFFYPGEAEWIDGYYEVFIDNTVAGGTYDVDFFTFTGLSPGAAFTAETLDPETSGVDTYLGWFDASGTLVEFDDDDAGGILSLIEGTVPANGQLTFAVTGCCDSGFVGNHGEFGTYELQLEINAALPGDFNNDGSVDAADYVMWRKDTATGDYATWRESFGEPGGGGGNESSSANVPESESVYLILAGAFAVLIYCVDARNRSSACEHRTR